MNKKYISIALTLYLFNPLESEATQSLNGSLGKIDETSEDGSRFSMIGSDSKHSKHKSNRSKSAGKRGGIAETLMDMSSVESGSVHTAALPKISLKSQSSGRKSKYSSIKSQSSNNAQKENIAQLLNNASLVSSQYRNYDDRGTQTQGIVMKTAAIQVKPDMENQGNQKHTTSEEKETMTENSNDNQNESEKDQATNQVNSKTDFVESNIEKDVVIRKIVAAPETNASTQTPTQTSTPEAITSTPNTITPTQTSPSSTSTTNTSSTTNHYYSTTNQYNTAEKNKEVPDATKEKPEHIMEKSLVTFYDIKSFVANISRSVSRALPPIFSKFIHDFNEMMTSSEKSTIKKLSKSEENTEKHHASKKKLPAVYSMMDNIKEKCASLRKSLTEFLQFTGSKKRVSTIQSENPNVRTRYRTLGEDFEKPKQAKSSRLFHLSGKRARKVITNALSNVRRVAIQVNKISYNTVDQNKRFSRPLNKSDESIEVGLKRSRIRTNSFAR